MNCRVQVIVTSAGMLLQKLDLKDMQFERQRPFDGITAYSQTKRQQVLMTEQYSKMWPNVHFSCMHPGWANTPGTCVVGGVLVWIWIVSVECVEGRGRCVYEFVCVCV